MVGVRVPVGFGGVGVRVWARARVRVGVRVRAWARARFRVGVRAWARAKARVGIKARLGLSPTPNQRPPTLPLTSDP